MVKSLVRSDLLKGLCLFDSECEISKDYSVRKMDGFLLLDHIDRPKLFV